MARYQMTVYLRGGGSVTGAKQDMTEEELDEAVGALQKPWDQVSALSVETPGGGRELIPAKRIKLISWRKLLLEGGA